MSNIENSTYPVYNITLYEQGANKVNAISDASEVAINVTGATSLEVFVPRITRFGVDNLPFLLGISAAQKLVIAKTLREIQDFTMNVISILYDPISQVFSFNGEVIESARWTDGFLQKRLFTGYVCEGKDTSLGTITLAGLTDVNIPAPTDGQLLSYDNGTGKWVAVDASNDPNKVTKGGDADAAPLVIGTQDANAVDVLTNNVQRFTFDTTGRLQSETVAYETLVDNDNVLTNKAYVDGIAVPTAAPALDRSNFTFAFPKTLGPQGDSVCPDGLVLDTSYNEVVAGLGQWYEGVYCLVSDTAAQGADTRIPYGNNKARTIIVRYLTKGGGDAVVYALLNSDLTTATKTGYTNTSDFVGAGVPQNVITYRAAGPATLTISLYGRLDSIAAGGIAVFSQPLPNQVLRTKISGIYSFQDASMEVGYDTILSWESQGNPVAYTTTGVRFDGGPDPPAVPQVDFAFTNGAANTATLVWESSLATESGFYLEINNPTPSWTGIDFLVRSIIENAVSSPSQIQYNVSGLTGVSFFVNNVPATVWTQADVDARIVRGTLASADTQVISGTLVLTDLRTGAVAGPVTFQIAIEGGYCRLDNTTAEALTRYARRDGTDTGSVLIGSQGGAATSVELRTTVGTAVQATDAGSTIVKANGDFALELETAGPSNNNSIILRPQSGANSLVQISDNNKSAAQYATDIAGDDSAVPNKLYVDNAVGGGVTNKAAKDGSDSGVVIVGSSDNSTSIIANSASPAGTVFQTTTGGATTVASQNADLTLLTQGTGTANIVFQPGATGGIMVTTTSASVYAARCIGNSDAIVNEQRVQDVVAAQTIGDHADVTITAPAQNDILTYQGVQWVNIAPNFAIKNLDLSAFDPTTAISPLTDTATGVVNQHFGGRRITALAGANLVSGRCVTVRNGAVSTVLEVILVDGGVGEEVAQSQMLGVTLADATAGNPVEIAIDGICSILAGAAGTAVRGGEVGVQSGSTGKLQSPGVNFVSDEVIAGFSLTQGAVALNAPVLVYLRPSFEHF